MDSSGSAQRLEVVVEGDEGSARLDRVLAARLPDLSRSRLKALILAGAVTLKAAEIRDPAYHVTSGDTIIIDVPEAAPAEPKGEDIALDIVFEDDDIVVLNKPKGLVVHPAAGHETGTLVNALIAHCGTSLSGIGGVRRPGIVHRLDKDTTGLMVVAKNDGAHQSLTAQFADHGRTGPLERAYLAFLWGAPDPARGVVEAAIARHNSNRERMAVSQAERARYAITRYAIEARYPDDADPVASLVRCTLETGRTHQIRVHMAHLRHPLVGDALYGAGFRTKAARLPDAARDIVDGLGRQALHATLLQFEHPETGEVLRFESPLPPDLEALRKALTEA